MVNGPGRTGRGRTRRDASRRGMALVLSLVILALGLAVGAAIAGNLIRATMLLRRQAESVEMAALMDAGMARALAELAKARSWPGDTVRLPVGRVDIAASQIDLESFRVELVGTYRDRTRRVEAGVLIRPAAAPEVTSWRLVLPGLDAADPLVSPLAPAAP